MKRFLSRLGKFLAFASLAALPIAVIAAQETDPAAAALPATGIQDGERALVIRFRYDPDTAGEFLGVFLSDTPSRQTASAAPQLEVVLRDRSGGVIDVFYAGFNHWTHSWSDQGVESLVKQPGRTGRIILPYSSDIDSVTVRDHALNQDVLEIGSQQLFQSICVAGRLDDPYVCSEERPDLVFKSSFE